MAKNTLLNNKFHYKRGLFKLFLNGSSRFSYLATISSLIFFVFIFFSFFKIFRELFNFILSYFDFYIWTITQWTLT